MQERDWPKELDERIAAVEAAPVGTLASIPSAGGTSFGRSRVAMQGYVVVIEGSGGSFGEFVPDLPGCVAVR